MAQHDPDSSPDGTISELNNDCEGRKTGSALGGSALISVDPSTGETKTLYGGRVDQKRFTPIRGQPDALPNGNTLISQSHAGRVFEVAREGEIVWELINRYDEADVAPVVDAIRYPPDYFEIQDQTGGSEAR